MTSPSSNSPPAVRLAAPPRKCTPRIRRATGFAAARRGIEEKGEKTANLLPSSSQQNPSTASMRSHKKGGRVQATSMKNCPPCGGQWFCGRSFGGLRELRSPIGPAAVGVKAEVGGRLLSPPFFLLPVHLTRTLLPPARSPRRPAR